MYLSDLLLDRPITVIYIKNQYLRKIDSISHRLKKMGVRILKKSANQGMIFVNPNTKKFRGKNLMDLEEIWKVEIWD